MNIKPSKKDIKSVFVGLRACNLSKKNQLVIDCTFGGGGYSEELLKFPNVKVIALDRDKSAIKRAAILKTKFLDQFKFYNEKFSNLEEISSDFALELLSHMKGGPSIEVLLDLVLDADNSTAQKASDVLKTQVFLYEADTERLKQAFTSGNKIVKNILESYSKAEFIQL